MGFTDVSIVPIRAWRKEIETYMSMQKMIALDNE